MSENQPETPENKTPEAAPAAPAVPEASTASAAASPSGSRTGKPVRRATASGSGVNRKPAGEGKSVPAAPAKPDMIKVVALGACGVLALACVVVLVYILAFKKKPPEKTANDKLAPAARALAEKADKAAKLYEEGKAKSGSDKLDELTESEKSLFEALNLFNEVADEYKTVPGFEDKIKLAHDKKQSIDGELKKVRDKKSELEFAADRERREKSKATQANKPADPAPVVTTPAGKEPTEEELSDKNLDRLFNDDPSEYERLAKIREKKDPNFKMKKP